VSITTYEELLEDEYRASGRLPKVVVLGQHDFDELCGELSRNFGVLLRAKANYDAELQYEGIHIFKSYANKHGVWFGGSEV
jgi:hypothetical protein